MAGTRIPAAANGQEMIMALLGRCFWLVLCAMSASAWADVMYQCVDGSGHKTFSNVKLFEKGYKCTPMDLGAQPQPAASAAKPAAKSPSPASFPKVGESAQKERDNDRQRILESELATEQKNLEQAKKDLAEQEAVRLGGERNYQRALDRLQPYKDKVALHERNIEAIQKELAKLR